MTEKEPVTAREDQPRPTLNELLEKARTHIMTPEEKEAQRQSWVRGEMGLANDERGMTTAFAPQAEAQGAALQIDQVRDATKEISKNGKDGNPAHPSQDALLEEVVLAWEKFPGTRKEFYKWIIERARSTPSPDQKGNENVDAQNTDNGIHAERNRTSNRGLAENPQSNQVAPDSPPQIVSAPPSAEAYAREYASSSNAALQQEHASLQQSYIHVFERAEAAELKTKEACRLAAEFASENAELQCKLTDLEGQCEVYATNCAMNLVELNRLVAERDGLREALRGIAKIPTVMANSYLLKIVEQALNDSGARLGTESTRRPEGAILPSKSGEVSANTTVNTDVEARLSGTEKGTK